jgi:hypothetical protein
MNDNIKENYLIPDNLNKLIIKQHKLINVKQNIEILNDTSTEDLNSHSTIINLNNLENKDELKTFKNVSSDCQSFIKNEDLKIKNNKYNERLININVKTVIESSKNDQYLDQDLCIIKSYVQKRKLDVKSMNLKINNYEEFKNIKKVKKRILKD